MQLPEIIQGGMGVSISNWRLARAVAATGQMGVVSGTALEAVFARRLQLGDLGGSMRRALDAFPFKEIAERVRGRYFVPGGKRPEERFRGTPMPTPNPSQSLLELSVVANFVEVFLAREGGGGPIGINYLEKIQLPTLPSLYGALLAGVSCVIMGAGIPRAIPGVLDRLAAGQDVELAVPIQGGARSDALEMHFSPAAFLGTTPPALERPIFLAIVSSVPLASMLKRKASGRVDGFVVEAPTAGGHNAPPRGALELDAEGEPIYGARDEVDLAALAELGLPFWLAGGRATPGALETARALGARGVQIGTAFAYCKESGMQPDLRRRVLAAVRAADATGDPTLRVRTDPKASPTGFPFKVLGVEGTLDAAAMAARPRRCDLGYLRQPHADGSGGLAWRCPAEPTKAFLEKGGSVDEVEGRLCICNGLMATAGYAQVLPDGSQELPLVTVGDSVWELARGLAADGREYSASDVIQHLLAPQPVVG